jgi:hypothetical protein
MPTLFRLNELSVTEKEMIEKQKPERKGVFKKLGETLKPMKYKMVIGPGNAEEWKITGNISSDKMAAELYSVFSEYDIPVISGMPWHRQLDIDQFHFTACPVNLKQFPAYLAASIELTMQSATLHDAMHCLQAPTAYRKSAAHPAAEVLRTLETILPSHIEEIKTSCKNVTRKSASPTSRKRTLP